MSLRLDVIWHAWEGEKYKITNMKFARCRYARTETDSDVVRVGWIVRMYTKLANICKLLKENL
jgi:hypothetical protein